MKQQIIVSLLLIIIGSAYNELYSQNSQTKPTRQSSLEAFSKGNYEQAYKEFSELLITYSKDPLYKYYSGICLVKLKRDPAEAVNLLQQALNGAAVVKTLPSDALFYLGRAQQMAGNFRDAEKSYISFADLVGKKAAREQGVPELIKQCNENAGKIAVPETKPVEIAKSEKVEVKQSENKPLVKEVAPKPIKETSVKSNLPGNNDVILGEALNFQFKADSLVSLAGNQKKELGKLPDNERNSLKARISEIELLAASFQKSADQKFREAQSAMNSQKEIVPPTEIIKQKTDTVKKDSTKQRDSKVINEADKQTDTIRKITPVVQRPVDIFSIFQVLPKPVTDPKEKISIDPDVPAGLIYRIQIAVFRNPVAPSYFKGITPVCGFKLRGTDKTNYYAGVFRRVSDANKALIEVKAKGFKDAFVTPLFENKPVSADRAIFLEKEWGKKPLLSIVENVPVTAIDTVPPTLSFRVEVIRSLKPLKEEVEDGIRKMAGNRGLDIQTLDDGNFAYLIGKFITFESANEFAGLLIRNGYPETRVVAWLGKKEIPVETARKLFENLQ